MFKNKQGKQKRWKEKRNLHSPLTGTHHQLEVKTSLSCQSGPMPPMMFFNNFFKFIYVWEREREREREDANAGGTERDRDRGSEAGSTLTAKNPMWVLNSGTVRSWAKVRHSTNKSNQTLHHPWFFMQKREVSSFQDCQGCDPTPGTVACQPQLRTSDETL